MRCEQAVDQPKPKTQRLLTARPLLKWPGGKSWLTPTLSPLIASYLDRTQGFYVEPFLGGASMALSLSRKSFLSDIVGPLIEFYTVLRDDPGGLAWNLSSTAILGVEEEDYYRVRDMRPETPVGRAARLMYLSRLCFNGVYRENRKGEFNVPYGDGVYRKSVIGRSSRDAIESLFPNREKIELASRALRQAEIWCGDFEEPISCAGPGDLVYADSPYDKTFDRYSKNGFSPSDQERLADSLHKASERGAVVIANNADTENIRRLYSWADIRPIKEQRRISNTAAKKRPRASCVLISSGLDLEGISG